MEQIAIIKKRSRLLPTIIALLIVALVVFAALYLIGSAPAPTAGLEPAPVHLALDVAPLRGAA
jgi:hypothetical protein